MADHDRTFRGKSRRMEFQAVVMAAGRGSRMTDLTAKTPKALLPIGNKPMIWYPINMLEKAGFTEAIVIVTKSALADIKKSLVEICHVGVGLDFAVIPDSDEYGTADALRHIKDKIETDILVVSCDLLTDYPLHQLADMHRTHDADVTMLMAPAPDVSQVQVPCPKTNRKMDRDFVGIEGGTKRVVYLKAESDVQEHLSIGQSCLRRHPHFCIHTNLLDAHLYLMKRSVLDILAEDRSISMLKAELLPILVSKRLKLNKKETESASTYERSQSDSSDYDLEQQAIETSTYYNPNAERKDKRNGVKGRYARCFALIQDAGGLCIRANTLVTYCEANRQLAKRAATQAAAAKGAAPISKPTQQVTTESLVGEDVSVGEKVGIKWSVVGDHCKIKDRVKITNCVIMDHVFIGSGAALTGCVVANDCHVMEKAELKDCLVGSRQTVATGKYTNEVIVDSNLMMEI